MELELRKIFNSIDKDGDGFLSMDEVEQFTDGAMQQQFNKILGRKANRREIFSIFDQNGDGRVSY